MTTKDFFEGVGCLDANSTYSDILNYLRFDMKSIAKLDEEKVHSEKVFYDDGKVRLTYADIFDKADITLKYNPAVFEGWAEPIKNWLRYRIATAWGHYDNGEKYEMGLYTEPFECDATEIAKEVLKRTMQNFNADLESVSYSNQYGVNGDNRFTVG